MQGGKSLGPAVSDLGAAEAAIERARRLLSGHASSYPLVLGAVRDQTDKALAEVRAALAGAKDLDESERGLTG